MEGSRVRSTMFSIWIKIKKQHLQSQSDLCELWKTSQSVFFSLETFTFSDITNISLYRYQIEFPVPWNLCVHGDGNKMEPAVITGGSNPNCRIIDLNVEKDNLRCKYCWLFKISFKIFLLQASKKSFYLVLNAQASDSRLYWNFFTFFIY